MRYVLTGAILVAVVASGEHNRRELQRVERELISRNVWLQTEPGDQPPTCQSPPESRGVRALRGLWETLSRQA